MHHLGMNDLTHPDQSKKSEKFENIQFEDSHLIYAKCEQTVSEIYF